MPKRVLIIDDDADVANLTAAALEELPLETARAADGKSGIAKALELKPDLLIVDLMMPGVHGYQVCERVRAEPALKGLRILVVSSKSYPVDMEAARNSGADAYLVKPFTVKDLRARVSELLGL